MSASQCCDEYAHSWPRVFWRTEASFDGGCQRIPGPKIKLVLQPSPVTTTTIVLPKVHPVVIVCAGILTANECVIDHQPDIQMPKTDFNVDDPRKDPDMCNCCEVTMDDQHTVLVNCRPTLKSQCGTSVYDDNVCVSWDVKDGDRPR